MKKLLLQTGLAIIATTGTLNAQVPGDLDVNFGIGGYAMSDPYANTGELYWDLITLSDDKIIKVGYTDDGNDTDILVSKFLADGTADASFGVNGFLKIDLSLGADEDARGILELPNGQLLITGYVFTGAAFDAYVMRLNADGTIDTTFGDLAGHTKFNTGDNNVAYGKAIVSTGAEFYVGGAANVGGQYDVYVANFLADGTLDNSFSTAGFATMDVAGENDQLFALDMQSNGAFVFGGKADSSGALIGFVGSFSQFGTATTFGSNGTHTVEFGSGLNEINDLYVDANDNVVLVGDEGVFPNVNGFVQRLTPQGIEDVTFGTGGISMSDPGGTTALFLRSVFETPAGEIVAVGNFDGASQQIYAMMMDSTGGFMSEFSGNGDAVIPFAISTNTVATMGGAAQSDGSIIIGGYLTSQDFVGENMFMVRLLPVIDVTGIETVSMTPSNVYPNPASAKFSVDMDGDIERVELIALDGTMIAEWSAQTIYELPETATVGTYLVRAYSSAGVAVERLSITK